MDERTPEEDQIAFNDVGDKASYTAANFDLINDTIITRAFLEEFAFVERIDHQIANAENRRNAMLSRTRSSSSKHRLAWREKIQNIEEAEFKVIKPRNPPGKEAKKKMRHDQRPEN